MTLELEGETWLPCEQLAESLCCSTRSIEGLKADGVFKPGQHFYSVGSGKSASGRGRHIYSLQRCRQALLRLTADRAAAKRTAEATAIAAAVTYDEAHLAQLITVSGGAKAALSYANAAALTTEQGVR